MQIIDDGIDFAKYLNLSHAEEIREPDYWKEHLANLFEFSGVSSGEVMPWTKTHEYVQFRPGEVSIWAGINGHGKSMVTGQVALWLMKQSKICIASMEMRPEATLQRMVRQASGVNSVSRDYQSYFLDWSKGRLWIYDKLDQVPTESILGMISYCANELGIKHYFIDSLMKCGIDDDNYNGQKRFVDQLCQVAKQLDVHIHLIAHMRKGESEYKRPGKFDVMGASALTNLVDNLFIIHRNKGKEEKLRIGQDCDESDQTITVAKQRHGDYEGVFHLWFHQASQQFLPKESKSPMQFPIGFSGSVY